MQDPGAGKLYPAAAGLLAAARDLPAAIELTRPAGPPSPPEKAAPPPVEPPPPAAEPWQKVVNTPVVDEETLAHVRFLAGDYAAAGAVYARLHEQAPDDVYVMQMLFLCLRDSGAGKDAAPLLEELKAKPESKEWADWISAMTALDQDAKEKK